MDLESYSGGDEGIHNVPLQDVPQQLSLDDLRAQINQLREQIHTLTTERDRVVRRQQDTYDILDYIQQVGSGTLLANIFRVLVRVGKETTYCHRCYEDLFLESQRESIYVTTVRMDSSSGGLMGPPQRDRDQGAGPSGESSHPQPQRQTELGGSGTGQPLFET